MGLAYGGAIVRDGLVLALDAADRNSYPGTGTTWYDLSGNGYNATLGNGPTFESNFNGTFDFDGTDDRAFGTSFTSNFTAGFTAEMWIKPDTSTPSIDGDLFIIGQHAANEPVTIWLDAEFNKYAWLFTDSSNNYSGVRYSNSDIVSNQFTHLVFTFTPNATSYLYINTVQDPNTLDVSSLSNIASSGESVSFFNETVDNDTPLAGKVGSLRTYNRALSASEVLQNYNATKTRFGL